METNAFYKIMIDQMSTSLLLLDQSFHLLYMNAAAERDLKYSFLRAKGLNFEAICGPPLGFMERLTSTIETNQAFTLRESQFNIHGQAVTLDISVTPIENSIEKIVSPETQNTPALLLELRPLDRILKISKEEQQADHHKVSRTLIRGIAHEVKNPLGGIRGATQLLERLIPDNQKDYTQLIIQEVDRLTALVDSMLGPHTPMKRSLINVHEILEHVILLTDTQYLKSIQFERHYDLSLPEISLDQDRCIQAILNICANAAQSLMSLHSPSEPPKIIITTQIARQITLNHTLYRHAIEILIEDNGPGIPDQLKDSLFYPFVTSKPEGSGIGLSIAQHILQEHGGIIEFESKPGHTRFKCFFPVI